MKSYSSLLFVSDFSACSESAVEAVASLAKLLNAKLHVLHCVEPVDMYATRYGTEQTLYFEMMKEIRTGANTDMQKLHDEFSQLGLQVSTVIREGKAADEIIAYAAEHNISMICISTHGWSGLKHFMLGSTTEKVLRRAPCPVFVIRCAPNT